MENRLGNSNGVGIPKKSRSLDLKTLYKSSLPKDSVNKSLKRKNKSGEVEDQQKQDRKGRKIVSLSTFEKLDSRDGEKVAELGNCDITLHDLVDSKVDLEEKLCNKSELQGISLGLGGSLTNVPRRRRGFVGRNRFENGLFQKSAGESVNQAELVDQIPKTAAEESSSAQDQLSQGREKDLEGEGKESDSASQLKLDNGHLSQPAVADGKLAIKQAHSSSKKRRLLAQDKKIVGEVISESGGTSGRITEVSREDDEENLEANAARMLCSRFDPSCTEFSSDANATVSPSPNRLSTSDSGKNLGSKMCSSKCVSDDTDDRLLRPRKKNDEKGTPRKRRHFYDVLFSDVDSHWLLNKKIKVFWPLDESWYHGLVDNYDEEKNLHHVKYDDRDEEWINLQGERFKILLFPAEVPGFNQQKRHRSGSKSFSKVKGNDPSSKGEKRKAKIEEDSCMGDLESEPIITWLARSSHRFKSSTLKAAKQLQKSTVSSSTKPTKIDRDTVEQDTCRPEISLNQSSSPKHSKRPIVYYRRRCHGTKQGTSGDSKVEVSNQYHGCRNLDPDIDFGPIGNSGTVELYIPWNDTKQFGLSMNLPFPSLMSYFLLADVIWLSRVVFLLHRGSVVTLWPRVCLELLVLDSEVGLRCLSFEGCLTEAVLLILRVLTVIDQSDGPRSHTDLKLPVSSIGIRLFSITGLQRHIAFGFDRFCEVKKSKWSYLEQNVSRHLLLVNQLSISECTYANIKAFRKGQELDPSASGNSLLNEGLQKRSKHDVSPTRASGETPFIKAWASFASDKRRSCVPRSTVPSTQIRMPHMNHLDHNSAKDLESSGNLASDNHSIREDFSGNRIGSFLNTTMRAHHFCNDHVCPSNHDRRTDELAKSGTGSELDSPEKGHNIGPNSDSSRELEVQDVARESQRQQQQSESENCISYSFTVDSPKTTTKSDILVNGIRIHAPVSVDSEEHGDRELHGLNIQGNVISSPNPTAPRSMGNRSRSSLSGFFSHGWTDSKGCFPHTNFGSGPKKPRTQVSYSLPSGASDSRSKGPLHKGLPHKRIRRSTDKKSADVSRGPQKDLESISCDANVLVTLGDRGWREYGAQIVLQPFDNNEYVLAVKISGTTRYSYRAHQFLQPGSTNRFTHAMMWKGGKDWILEFPDRSQWSLFKEMHEECHNRNIRAASVRNIPIPGIRLIEKDSYDGTEAAFTRNSSKYVRQTENDVEMALNPLRVMYDMDSDDEQWLLRIRECSEAGNSGSCEITEDMFEKSVDMFEKAAHVKHCDQFTLNEIEELMSGAGPLEALKLIYEHWRAKRQRKGMSLIRQLQPPLWEKYQREVREWELAMTKANIPYSSSSQEKRVPVEKPAMFAFCLKPRGLQVHHKGSKHRSQKKLSVYAHHNNAFRDHDGLNSSARRSGGFASGDERCLYSDHSYDYMEESPLHHQVWPGMYSPRGPGNGCLSMSGNGYYRNTPSKFQRNNSRKSGALGDMHMSPLYNQRINGKRARNDLWNPMYSEWTSSNPYYSNKPETLNEEEFHGTDTDEYKLRNAVAGAKRARALAKLKRERAERLSHRADLAIQKAATALMCAEAIREGSRQQ